MTQREIMRHAALMSTDAKYATGYLELWARSPREDADKVMPEIVRTLKDLQGAVDSLCGLLCPEVTPEVMPLGENVPCG